MIGINGELSEPLRAHPTALVPAPDASAAAPGLASGAGTRAVGWALWGALALGVTGRSLAASGRSWALRGRSLGAVVRS